MSPRIRQLDKMRQRARLCLDNSMTDARQSDHLNHVSTEFGNERSHEVNQPNPDKQQFEDQLKSMDTDIQMELKQVINQKPARTTTLHKPYQLSPHLSKRTASFDAKIVGSTMKQHH